MPSLVKNSEIEGSLRKLLERKGYFLNRICRNGETGVDICATRRDEAIFIEVIGYKSSGPARAKDFYESFFRVISRLDNGAKRLVIAIPSRAKVGLPARARQHKTGWTRIGKAFPELEIWLVDPLNDSVQKTSWRRWLFELGK